MKSEVSVFLLEGKKEAIKEVAKWGIKKVVVAGNVSTPKVWQEITSLGLEGFLEFGVFVGESWWIKYADSRPVDKNGGLIQKLGKSGWYAGVCPTHEKVRKDQLEKLGILLEKLPQVKGVILDFIRFPGRWEDGIQKENYCFCPRCRDLFSEFLGKRILGRELNAKEIIKEYPKEFHQWKAEIIFSFILEAAKLIKSRKREIGIFTLPYQREIYGQNLKKFSKVVDTFYLMAYHKLLGYPIGQIKSWLKEAKKETVRKVVPVIQAFPEPPLPLSEFQKSLKQTRGETMIFFFEAMEKEKREMVKELDKKPYPAILKSP